MRKSLLLVVMLSPALILSTGIASAQSEGPPPAQAMDVTAADFQAMIKAYPGANAQIKSVDAGKYVVDVWLEQRRAGLRAPAGQGGIAHSEITEVYYILQGAATLVTGGTLVNPTLNQTLLKMEFPGGARLPTPTYGGRFEGGVSRKVSPGDVIVMPPGTVHQWASVDEGQGLAYFIVRIDPERKLAAGLTNPILKK